MNNNTIKCPFCAEQILREDTKCKFCKEDLIEFEKVNKPVENKIIKNFCPVCKEEINENANKCKHCGAIQNTAYVKSVNNKRLIWGLVCLCIAGYIIYYGYTTNWVFQAFIDGMIEPFIYLF